MLVIQNFEIKLTRVKSQNMIVSQNLDARNRRFLLIKLAFLLTLELKENENTWPTHCLF